MQGTEIALTPISAIFNFIIYFKKSDFYFLNFDDIIGLCVVFISKKDFTAPQFCRSCKVFFQLIICTKKRLLFSPQ